MFVSNVQLAAKYDYLAPTLKRCYKWIATHDIKSMADGRYEICDGAFALVQRYTTRPLEQCRFEAHYQYLDIQYLAAGVEGFGVCEASGLEVTEDRPEDDIKFFAGPDIYDLVVLQAGKLVVVPPENAHQPGMAYQGKLSDVVKVVVKVKV